MTVRCWRSAMSMGIVIGMCIAVRAASGGVSDNATNAPREKLSIPATGLTDVSRFAPPPPSGPVAPTPALWQIQLGGLSRQLTDDTANRRVRLPDAKPGIGPARLPRISLARPELAGLSPDLFREEPAITFAREDGAAGITGIGAAVLDIERYEGTGEWASGPARPVGPLDLTPFNSLTQAMSERERLRAAAATARAAIPAQAPAPTNTPAGTGSMFSQRALSAEETATRAIYSDPPPVARASSAGAVGAAAPRTEPPVHPVNPEDEAQMTMAIQVVLIGALTLYAIWLIGRAMRAL